MPKETNNKIRTIALPSLMEIGESLEKLLNIFDSDNMLEDGDNFKMVMEQGI